MHATENKTPAKGGHTKLRLAMCDRLYCKKGCVVMQNHKIPKCIFARNPMVKVETDGENL